MEELYVVIYTDYDDGCHEVCMTSLEENLFKTKDAAQECIDYIVGHGYPKTSYRIAKLSFLD